MSRKIKRSDCTGCYNEFYHNGGVSGNSKKCWSFDDASLSLGRPQHKDTMPENYRGRFKLIPDCFIYQYGFIEREKWE